MLGDTSGSVFPSVSISVSVTVASSASSIVLSLMTRIGSVVVFIPDMKVIVS